MGKNTSRATTLVILLASHLAASTVTPLSLREVSTRASRVTAGRVERVTARRDSQSGRIVSRIEIAEARALAGQTPGRFSFEMVGGTAEGIRQWIAGFPAFEAGDQVVLFLAQDTTTPLGPTVGLWQGVFFVQKDAGGQEIITDHARRPLVEIRGEELVRGPAGRGLAAASSGGLTLEAFLSQVRAWREAR